MKVVIAVAVSCLVASSGFAEQTNPLGKVLELLDTLSAKVTADGEAETKAFKEYLDWCDGTSANGKFAIEDASKQKDKLQAEIGKLIGDLEANEAKISEFAQNVAQAEGELKDATAIREKEQQDFKVSEAELVDVLDILVRAINILRKEMSKKPTAFTQVDSSNTASMLQALSTVLDAAAFSSRDQKMLADFLQSQQPADEAADPFNPTASPYASHSKDIVEVLEDMNEKAEQQLSDLRKAEVNGRHNFEMLRQSLVDQMKADTQELEQEKTSKGANVEAKATAEGDLKVTAETLATAKQDSATAETTCMQVAADHEATVASREGELHAIAEAKRILDETSAGAVAQSYALVQVGSRIRSRTDLAKSEVLTMVKQLAKNYHSAALAQLVSKISAFERYASAAGEDPFAKVRGLITDLIAKLENEAALETTEKAWCDDQMSKTEAKQGELEDDVAKMTSKLDKAISRSAELKEQVAALQRELSTMAKEQAEMDRMRTESHAAFLKAEDDLELGLKGVRQALGVLDEYYGSGTAEDVALVQDESRFGTMMQRPALPEKHSKAQGAGSSIIGMLEVVETDLAKNLAKEQTEEDDSQSDYDKVTHENKITVAAKEADVKYKTQEATSLDKTISEISSDRATTETELAALNEYYDKVKGRCIAKPETYEARKARREAELQGLKQALAVLEDETALVQRKRRSFRGPVLSVPSEGP